MKAAIMRETGMCKQVRKTGSQEAGELNQEVDSRDKVIHIEKSDL